MHRWTPAFLFLALAITAPAIEAQTTPSDSAAVLLDAARRLESDGNRQVAEALYEHILRRFPGTAAADQIATLLATRGEPLESGGRFRFVGWGAVYGAWLGVAMPASFGADNSRTYGVGLLLGGPAGLVGALQYARAARPTRGQADAMVFGSQWGTWQGFGWNEALDFGAGSQRQVCDPQVSCYYEDTSDRAAFRSMVVGGVGGLVAGTILGRRVDPTEGQMSFVSNAAGWGTWFGLAGGIVGGSDGDNLLTTTLIAGNAGLLAGLVAAPRDVTPGRVWLTTAAGIAGAAAGFGVDLLVQPDNSDVVMAYPAVLSAAGLVWGWHLTRPLDARRRAPARAGSGGPGSALLERCGDCGGMPLGEGWRVGAPLPEPGAAVLGLTATGRRVTRPALTIPLVRATF